MLDYAKCAVCSFCVTIGEDYEAGPFPYCNVLKDIIEPNRFNLVYDRICPKEIHEKRDSK